jgi:hypothetical protein
MLSRKDRPTDASNKTSLEVIFTHAVKLLSGWIDFSIDSCGGLFDYRS